MAEQDLDRHLPATPFKLQKAREKGQSARSADFAAAVVFSAAAVFAGWQGWGLVVDLLQLCRATLVQLAGAGVPADALASAASHTFARAAEALVPFLLLLVTAAGAASLMQSGAVVSFEPLKPDPQRLNPAAGLKRVFSRRTLFEGARACAKLVVLSLTAWFALKSLLPQFHALAGLPPLAFLHILVQDVGSLSLKMGAILIAIALLDLAYNRFEFSRQMRMSAREQKDETKQREGDPRIRSRLRELRREMLRRSRALRNTAKADVVLTNPTHYAVALRYVHGEMDAPVMVAKGAGHLAAAMRHIAFRKRIPIVRNPSLARRLFAATQIDQAVAADFHAEVAKVIVWVFALREQRLAASR